MLKPDIGETKSLLGSSLFGSTLAPYALETLPQTFSFPLIDPINLPFGSKYVFVCLTRVETKPFP